MFSPTPEAHRVHTIHRLAAASTGLFLVAFGVLGSLQAPRFFSTSGPEVLGLFTNGLLATLSLLMGAALIFAAVRSGPVASTISVAAGGLFLLSGLVNAMILGSAMNMLAFAPVNVLFSLVVGAILLVLGSYGRFSGALPSDSPYARYPGPVAPVAGRAALPEDERALAEAERAMVRHVATAEQAAQVFAASAYRTHDERLHASLAAVPASTGSAR
nr:DUF4383 domain-containing protein [Actinomycetospora sp. NBRC 106375]